jgi:hypothetical protein
MKPTADKPSDDPSPDGCLDAMKVRSTRLEYSSPPFHIWVTYENGCSERLFVPPPEFNGEKLVGCPRAIVYEICREAASASPPPQDHVMT